MTGTYLMGGGRVLTGAVVAATIASEAPLSVSVRHGFRASFAPSVVPGTVGNGGHVHLSIWRDGQNLLAGVPKHPDNGDEARYPEHWGSYSKGLQHDQYGQVLPSSYASFVHAMRTGRPSDFAAIQGFVLVAAAFSLLVYLAVDLLYFAMDPRIRP